MSHQVNIADFISRAAEAAFVVDGCGEHLCGGSGEMKDIRWEDEEERNVHTLISMEIDFECEKCGAITTLEASLYFDVDKKSTWREEEDPLGAGDTPFFPRFIGGKSNGY